MDVMFCARDIGSYLRDRRKALRVTQTQLAQLCGVSASFISDLENGKPTVEFDRVIRVANMLGMDLVVKARGEHA